MSGRHALCCITDAIEDLLSGQPGLSVSLNRDDCWNDEKLHIEGQCAANIIVRQTIPSRETKNRRISTGETVCTYTNVLPLDIELYAISCEGSMCKAAAASGFILRRLLDDNHGLPVMGVHYRGETFNTTQRGDNEFTHIVIQVEIEYIFSPVMPWKTWKGK